MAFTVTDLSGADATVSSSADITSGTFTPANDALVLLIAAGFYNSGSSNVLNYEAITTTSAKTVTNRLTPGDGVASGNGGGTGYDTGMQTATIQEDSSATVNQTFTADFENDGSNGHGLVTTALGIEGHDSASPVVEVNESIIGAYGGAESLVKTTTPVTGNLLVFIIGESSDDATPTAATSLAFGGRTPTTSAAHAANFARVSVYYLIVDGTETNKTFSYTRNGNNGAAGVGIIEIAIASSDINVTLPFVSDSTSLFTPVLSRLETLPFIAAATSLFTPVLSRAMELPFLADATTINTPVISRRETLPFIADATSLFTPVVSRAMELPFLADATALFTPTMVSQIELPFIADATSLFTPVVSRALVLPFIADATTIYTPVVSRALVLPFLADATIVFTPSAVLVLLPITLPFIAGSTNIYTFTLENLYVSPHSVPDNPPSSSNIVRAHRRGALGLRHG